MEHAYGLGEAISECVGIVENNEKSQSLVYSHELRKRISFDYFRRDYSGPIYLTRSNIYFWCRPSCRSLHSSSQAEKGVSGFHVAYETKAERNSFTYISILYVPPNLSSVVISSWYKGRLTDSPVTLMYVFGRIA